MMRCIAISKTSALWQLERNAFLDFYAQILECIDLVVDASLKSTQRFKPFHSFILTSGKVRLNGYSQSNQ